jgi:acyl-[acyl-carrier-protein]-phospholipid O-acyltransferase/long-chain-fatty-acid--[acyl-carrier-protein] ligase
VAESLSAPDPYLVLGSEIASLFDSHLLWPVMVLVLLVSVVFACWRHPFALLVRWPCWLAARLFYGMRVMRPENVPTEGAALICANHVCYLDWIFLLAAIKRPIRFIIFEAWTRRFGLRHLLRWTRALPIDAWAGPRAIVRSLRAAGDALQQGSVVGIFPEGRLTRNGYLMPFHRGLQYMAERGNAPIVPVYLDGLWGALSSFYGGKLFWKRPRRRRHPIRVAVGEALPAHASAFEVRQALQKLAADCARERLHEMLPVHRAFVRRAARHPFRSCFVDSATGTRLTYGRALAGAMILADKLRPILGDERMVGLWLPSSLGGALANITVALLGKTSVNLNYTAGPEAVRSAIHQCGIRHILTSVQFLRNKPLDVGPDVQLVYLEDFRKQVTKWQRLWAYLKVLLLPLVILERWVLHLSGPGHRMEDVATVIFSSGSTGEAKGVMLTHGNIAANAQSMVHVVQLTQHDRLLGILPFFHSFGYTVTLWVPLQIGGSIVYHPDPRQAKKIGELCRQHQCSIFLSTPTFLRFYLRQCDPGDFKSVRLLYCGAEKLPQPLAREFERKFGILPFEAYGCTELSPAAVANIADREIDGFKQIGHKPGSIGLPLPGVAARIVDPDTLQPLGADQEGMLLIYGPNVMKGYLGRGDLTANVVRDGWYVTGDVAKIDEDGFITITGRLSRFAKTGGEMVPLERLEDEIHAVLQTSERVCVVTCVPDEARGERLVVLHLPLDGRDPRAICDQLGKRGLSNLWIPAERDFYLVTDLPILGSGKVDLQRLREIALERSRRRQAGEPPAA